MRLQIPDTAQGEVVIEYKFLQESVVERALVNGFCGGNLDSSIKVHLCKCFEATSITSTKTLPIITSLLAP